VGIGDQIVKVQPMKAHSKIKAVDVCSSSGGQLKVLLCLANNSLDLWSVERSKNSVSLISTAPFQVPAHPSNIRAVTFSSDDACIASGSSDQVRVWNRETQHCIRSFASGYVLSLAFAPGNRHVFAGTKAGEVELYDIGGGVLLESISAHSGAVWSLEMTPDKKGFVTGSADHDVKFWEFDLKSVSEGEVSRKVLTATHVKTLKMAEDVLCVKSSPNQKFLAVALLDSTVKVLFWDTLKFYLSLYGHRLPVLCMDISSDNTLIVTGSSDKNIKIWGMDFGDCHRSIFAHDDSIMALQFAPKTHLVFTAGKDKTVKCWDVDSFEHVMTLDGHQGEVWTLAVSHDGDTVVSGSHDNSMRLWERTDEPLILSEEREIEREMEFEEDIAKNTGPVIPGETNEEVSIAGRKTIESVKAAERIIEAIDIFREESAKMADHKARCAAAQRELPVPTPHPILMAYGNPTPERYVLNVVKRVRSSELDESLLVMPFLYVIDFLSLLKHWLECGWEVELSCKCLFFLLKVHHKQIVANRSMVTCLEDMRGVVSKQITRLKDTTGFNLAVLQLCQREMRRKGVHIFEDVSLKTRKNAKKRKVTVVTN
jgi:U3 small nucleolar RNA-associated protein 12